MASKHRNSKKGPRVENNPYREESFKHMGVPAGLRKSGETYGEYIDRTSAFIGRPMSDQEIEESKRQVKEEQHRQEIKLKSKGKKMRRGNPSGHAKDMNRFLRDISRDPFNCRIDSHGKHHKIKCPGAGIVVASKTPRSGLALQETRSRLKREGIMVNPPKYKRMGVDYDPYAELRANQNNPYAFVHYSNIEKLGINPSSTFETPLGIYAYPINQFPIEDIIRGNVPFAGGRSYIHLFTASAAGIVFIQGMTQEQDAHFGKLAEEYANRYKISLRGSRNQSGFGRYWYATHQVTTNASMWRSKLVADGVQGVVDYGSGIIHPSEPTQAVFFSKSFLSHIGTFRRKEKLYPEAVIRRAMRGENLAHLLQGSGPDFRELVAKKIDPSYLPQMMNDKSPATRLLVAQRVDPSYLPQMMNDGDPDIRQLVAERIDPSHLPQMMNDEYGVVRKLVARRIDEAKKSSPELQQNQNPRRKAKKLTNRSDLPTYARKCHEMYERYLNTKNARTLKACHRRCFEGKEHKDVEVRNFCRKFMKKIERKMK